MDIEKLIEQLNEYFEGKELGRGAALDAATALSTFQAENEKLRAELEQKSKLIAQQAAELERRDTLLKEQETELERMKQERDAAVKDIPHECKTCAYHMVFFNGCTPDHDCTNPDGGCSNNYDRWIWRGQKED